MSPLASPSSSVSASRSPASPVRLPRTCHSSDAEDTDENRLGSVGSSVPNSPQRAAAAVVVESPGARQWASLVPPAASSPSSAPMNQESHPIHEVVKGPYWPFDRFLPDVLMLTASLVPLLQSESSPQSSAPPSPKRKSYPKVNYSEKTTKPLVRAHHWEF